jgi:lysophospholipase L1-like esterase
MRFGVATALLLGAVVAGCSATKAEGPQQTSSPPSGVVREAPSTPGAASATNGPGLITALGDSITLGIANTSRAKAYPGQLGALVRMNVVNLGAKNVLTANVTTREVPLIPRGSTVVIIQVGTIDASVAAQGVDSATAAKNVKRFEPDFDALLSAVRQRVPRASVVVVTVRDLGRAGIDTPLFHRSSLSAAVHELNNHERLYATSHAAKIVDTEVDPQWYIPAEYDGGRIHPTDAGAARLARAISAVIQQ